MSKLLTFFLLTVCFAFEINAQPVSLNPVNSHYLHYKGKPLLLISSAEHYGAVLNADFDFEKYLKTLHDEGMNYTRLFSGAYIEIPGSFGIKNNNLAPEPGSYIAPWERVDEPGLYEGEKKFDLTKWNPEYFDRLNRFVSMASDYDIIVEMSLFCSTYQDESWKRHPFNPGNNINGLPEKLDRKKSNTLANGNLTGFQKELVKKIVTELNKYDNVFFEIQNEPWSDNPQKVMRTLKTLDPLNGEYNWFKWAEVGSGASLKWQKIIAQTIADTEKELPKKHLIAQNFSNFKCSVDDVDPNVSIMNFHYVWPEAVWLNYGWNRPVNFDESGFAGNDTKVYLKQAWQFILAGGAVFNNLDYSFTIGHETGTGTNKAPGAGSALFREQLTYLRSFMESFDFIKMKPDFNVVVHSPGAEWQSVSEPGKQYAIVFSGNRLKEIKLDLPKGKYYYFFLDPYSGRKLKKGFFKQNKNEIKTLLPPEFEDMVALKIVAE